MDDSRTELNTVHMLKYGGTVNGNVKVISAVVNIGNQSKTKSREDTMKGDDGEKNRRKE